MSRISNFPIMFFAIIMGFGGFSMAIRKVSVVFEINSLYFDIFKIITSAIFLLVVLLYAIKIFINIDEVKSEFNHQIR
ncbi:MAG: C4-dicarboxylate ABC transporter, partial [Campylobacter sp.]|nr:C4-dicarboxylate ABC transporter [Campylobacter sp.]